MWSESDNLYSRNESKVYSVMVNERNIWLMSRYTSGCVQGPKNGSISFILGFGAEEGKGLGSKSTVRKQGTSTIDELRVYKYVQDITCFR